MLHAARKRLVAAGSVAAKSVAAGFDGRRGSSFGALVKEEEIRHLCCLPDILQLDVEEEDQLSVCLPARVFFFCLHAFSRSCFIQIFSGSPFKHVRGGKIPEPKL